MRRLLSIILAVTFVFAATSPTLSGQDATRAGNPLFNPHVPTIWHSLGGPQSLGRFRLFRESRVNRKGNNPQREKKPKLKKLTDAANIDPNALPIDPKAPEMIKAAAQIKKAEDLAPQKLKALKYLGTLGCGCYNKKNADLIEGALLEALEDCTPAIRKEALNVILKQVAGGCGCCQPACNPKSCCTAKIYKKLFELANNTSDFGCPAETDPSIRALAKRVFNACPPPLMEPDYEPVVVEPPPTPPQEDPGREDGAEEESVLEGAGQNGDSFDGPDPGENEPNNGSEQPIPDEDLFDEGNDGDSSRRRTSQVSFRRQPGSLGNDSAVDRELLQQLGVTGVVRSIRLDEGNATIVFDDPYEFPRGLQVVVATGRDFASFGTVEITEIGTAVIEIEDHEMLNHLQKFQRIRLGVLE